MFEKYPKWLLGFREKTLIIFSKYSIPRWIVFSLDNLSVFFVFFLAYLLRFNFIIGEIPFDQAIIHVCIVITVYAFFELIFRSYSGLIRHTTLTDISLIFVSTTSSALVLVLFSLLSRVLNWGEYLTIPFSVILIHYGLITIILFFIRVAIKMVFRFATSSSIKTKKVLIYGAGDLGFVVKRVILSDPEYGFEVAGFIDTNKNLLGKKINGIPVYNPDFLNAELLSKHKIKTVILAIKDITVEQKSEIIRSAISLGLEVLETPEVNKWLNGQLQARQFQKVKLEDLLGRQPIKLDLTTIRDGLNNKIIMVTGAAGSIGSEIVRQLTRFNSKKVVLIDNAETPMFHLENELRERFNHLQVQMLLADVTNHEKMEQIFSDFRPEIIFHAAAYKHVSLMEENPHESVRVNAGGTKTLIELSVKYKVKKFVMISTDKSVNPTSVMGASKRICEMIVQSASKREGVKTQFVTTRFGNVLGSNGSVVPIFTRQIELGGPVTVTHPEVTRYFMTIPEACELVLEAGFMGKGGEIFVFDMGNPVKITDLADQMIRLSGLIPDRDIKIVYTGLRPGEKLYEELLTDKETSLPTHNPKINKAKVEVINNAKLILIDKLLKNLYSFSKHEVIELISKIVPEYKCSNGKYNVAQGSGRRAQGSELRAEPPLDN
jgi:FlaA1/EpsC-like NDP-sugar epimerase